MPYKDPEKRRLKQIEYDATWRKKNVVSHRKAVAVWEAAHPSSVSKRNKRYIQNLKRFNPAKYLFLLTRRRTRQTGMEFSIELEDVEVPATCPILGIPLSFVIGMRGNVPTIDRIDNSRGYIPGNIWVISWRANRLKSDASLDELVRLGKAAKKMKDR